MFFLIIVKNEYHQLRELLNSLKTLKHEDLEIAVVDDHSDPENSKEMEKTVSQFNFASWFKSKGIKGKKQAIYPFVKELQNKNLVFTDADCRPASENYATIVSEKIEHADLVLGYGPYFKEVGLLNKLSRFDCMWIAAQYLGSAVGGDAYMGVGRNIVVKSSLYQKVLSKIKGKKLMSGDDDMLIQAMNGAEKIDIVIDPESFMFSKAESSYGSLLRQKTRHIETSYYYKLRHKIWLTLTAISSIVCFPLIISFLLFFDTWFGLTFLIVKIVMSYLLLTPIAKKLKEEDLILFLPLWEIVYGFHLVILGLYGMLSNNKVWK